jgi:hypothetical protein
MGRGMYNLCKMAGGLKFIKDGITTEFVFDYDRDECVPKSEMDKERQAKSDKAKFEKMKAEFEKLNQQKSSS